MASAILLLSIATPVHAGHEPLVPEPRTILIDPGDANRIVVGTRLGGYYSTSDGGESWHWLCEAGIGYDDEHVYASVALPGSSLISLGYGGIARSSDGCGWSSWLPDEPTFIADLEADAVSGRVVALNSGPDAALHVNQLWAADDGGATWQRLGTPLDGDLRASSLALVSGDPERLFVGGAGPSGAELMRSLDGGASWSRSTVVADPSASFRLIGSAGDTLFAIVDHLNSEGAIGPGDRVMVSSDAGGSWRELLQAGGDLPAAALSPDGQRLAVGGPDVGIHVLADPALAGPDAAFQRVSSVATQALAWSADRRLFSTGYEPSDGFSLAVSTDDARTFSALLALCQVKGPLECASDTSIGQQCLLDGDNGWLLRREFHPNPVCEQSEPAHGHEEPEPAAEPHTDETASGCSLGGTRSRSALLVLTLLAAASRLRRRAKVSASLPFEP